MTNLSKSTLSFAVILGAGIAVFTWQSQQLKQLQSEAAAREKLTGAPGAGDPAGAAADSKKRAERRMTTMERVNAELFESVKPEEIGAFLHSEDELRRIGLAVALSEAERAEIESVFADFDAERARISLDTKLTGEERTARLAEVAARKKAWLDQRLGPERAGVVAEAETGFMRDRAGQQAAQAVARVSRAVDLTAGQAEQLRAGFLERKMNPPAAATPALALRPFGGVSLEPAGPNIDAEAEQILTPEQMRAWRGVREANGSATFQQTMFMMNRIMPNFFSALRKATGED